MPAPLPTFSRDKAISAPRDCAIRWDVLREGNEVGDHAVDLGLVVITDGRAARYGRAEDGFA